MVTITRAEFKAAIEAGISEAPKLTEDEKARLREIGAHAPEFGTNFNTGCPAAVAGLSNAAEFNFACGFDDALADRIVWLSTTPKTIYVVEEEA